MANRDGIDEPLSGLFARRAACLLIEQHHPDWPLDRCSARGMMPPETHETEALVTGHAELEKKFEFWHSSCR